MRAARPLAILALSAAVGTAAASGGARAQTGFVGATPVFQSDVEQRERQREAERAERAKSYPTTKYPAYMQGGDRPRFTPEVPPIVHLSQGEAPGTVIVDTAGRKLYYVLPGSRAYAYPITVGRVGFTWTGTERISRIQAWPSWTPPPEMRQRQPGLPITVTGGILNPMGAKALYLGSSIYRIHGTNNDSKIGRASSSGCFRMTNPHIEHLATLVKVGTQVRVVSSYPGVSESPPLASLFSGFGSSGAAAAGPASGTARKAGVPRKGGARQASAGKQTAAPKQKTAAKEEAH